MLSRYRTDVRWVLIAVGVIWLTWAAPLLGDARHYFHGDSQNAYYGWFHHFGTALLHGSWPMLDAQTGSAGNPLAEGQEGLYSPLSALIGIGAAVAPQVVVYATLVRFAIATIGVVGVYLLARGYGVRPGLAAVAAVAAQLGGFTLSADAPRWLTGQLVAALLPWAWWATRRLMAGANPWPALLASGVLVTTGYVFGTMYLAIVLGGLLLEGLIVRDWPGLRRIVLLGVFCSLLAATVYLPGILTSPVTWRDTWIIQGDDGFLQMDPVTLLLTGQPTTVPPSVSYFGVDSAADQPSFIYVAWFLPLLCWVGFTRLRTGWRSLVSLVVPFVLFVTWTLMPYYMGPIRMPGRVMSVVTLTAVLLVVVLLERTLQGRPGRLRVGLSLLWVALAAAGAALLQPHYTALQLGAGAVVLACVVAAAWAAGRGRLLPVVMIVGSVVVAMFQFTFQGTILGGDRGAPGSLAEYSTVLPDTQGDVFVIGLTRRLLDRHPELGRSLPSGSLWDLSGKPVHDGYTTLGFRKYNFRFCVRYNGDVCGNALKRMLAVEPTTGLRWVDLHSISSLVLVRTRHHGPPPGWHVARRDPHVVTWVRDHVVPTAGGVVWTSPGTRVRQVGQSETSATFVVESVGADGGRVVLSRLAWPGYQIHGARIGAPLGGHLLSVRLAPGDVGRTVKVYFRPPGWELEMACLAGALALGSAWSVIVWVRRRRSRPTPPEAGAAAEEPTVPATSP